MNSMTMTSEVHSIGVDPDDVAAASAKARGKPLVSVMLPAYNEATIIEQNLARVHQYMSSMEHEFRWEMVIVNDGSQDKTGELAERFAARHDNVRVFHHLTNFGLGQALRLAALHCKGDYLLMLDMDLSYSPDHIARLLTRIRETRAEIVLTSPYMEGGQVSNVPWLRRTLSTWANRFLAASVQGHLSTLTSMVRVYDGPFLRSLNLRSMGMDVMPEILYKAKMLGARVRRLPGRMQRKAEEGEAADARQGRCGLRLRGHAAAEGLAAGDQRKCRCKLRGCGHGSPNGRMRKFGRVGPPGALFHVRKLITQRGDAALTKLPRDDIHEWVEHSGSRPMGEDVAGACACWRQ